MRLWIPLPPNPPFYPFFRQMCRGKILTNVSGYVTMRAIMASWKLEGNVFVTGRRSLELSWSRSLFLLHVLETLAMPLPLYCAFYRISYRRDDAVGSLWVWTLSSSRCFPDLSVPSRVSIVSSFLLPSASPLYGNLVICFSIQVLVDYYGKNHSALWGVVRLCGVIPFVWIPTSVVSICLYETAKPSCSKMAPPLGAPASSVCVLGAPHLCQRPVLSVAHGVEFKPLSYVCLDISLWFYLHFPSD